MDRDGKFCGAFRDIIKSEDVSERPPTPWATSQVTFVDDDIPLHIAAAAVDVKGAGSTYPLNRLRRQLEPRVPAKTIRGDEEKVKVEPAVNDIVW